MRRTKRILVSKPEEKRQFGRSRYIWEDNIKIDLKEHNMRVWTGFVWLRIEISGRFL
jgi:hypothetical protein